MQIPVQTYELPNGLFVTLSEDHTAPIVAVNLWYHVGSANERVGRTGFAHLFEHMLFQGSQHVGTNDHFRYVQQVGGVANGSTWYDRTNYYETLPSNELALGLWLEADRMKSLAITQENFENQRQTVMEERAPHTWVEIRDVASRRLVTTLEILSPWNIMCSNRCAKPERPLTSLREPTS